MIFFTFLFIYWDFNFDDLQEKIKDSVLMPMFVICYVPKCTGCAKIKETYNDFIAMTGNRTDIYTSMVNCIEYEDYCKYMNTTVTPTSVLIMGENPRYWPKTTVNSAEEWNTFIDRYIGGNLKKIKSKEQLDEVIQKTTENGGVTYYLQVPKDNDENLRKIRRRAYHFLIYNVSFAYSIDESLEKPKFQRFYSKNCKIEFNDDFSQIDDFINEIKFGPTHKYNMDEWNKIKNVKMAVVVNENELLEIQKNELIRLSDSFCTKVNFGWISIQETPEIMNEFSLQNDFPINLISDESRNCYSTTKHRLMDIYKSKFIHKFLNQQIECGEMFGHIEVQKTEHKVNNHINAGIFTIGYITSGLLIIGLLRLRDDPESKIE
ncbi:hypothetical protein TRFO_33177 [Tritrichomonas foetus]|uniref:Thioredoxin domain-containing protein n=1 Tax=Tritrichomonas foetus TaxID=1144522 RepID=A0A1J4JM60_9EUKA|nr:hypothetical protein TRFO_33177 [Tritrichomonas foetus]|eukprot:OHT00191.1 hypothetical protein TRFO_33177 [Tritrichomonas foetus]